MAKYDVGQRWSYRTREQVPGSTLIIGRAEKRLLMPQVIHVMVDAVTAPDETEPFVIGHLPLSKQALGASVLELLETDVQLGEGFEKGIAIWKQEKGGVFDGPVAEAIDTVLSALQSVSFADPFDALVTEMRSKPSEEHIDELYQQLFALKQWFFLCEPDDAGAPVQWEFPDGRNATPALLAFTSHERAVAAASSLGIYPQGATVSIMPASVQASVEWINSSDCSNDWLCFNLTQENFPLYCDDALRLLQDQ